MNREKGGGGGKRIRKGISGNFFLGIREELFFL